MDKKLVILDGIEKGVEILVEEGKIYSIGTGDDCDFFLQESEGPFLAYFSLSGDQVDWWANRKIPAQLGNETKTVTSNKIAVDLNTPFGLAGRWLGIYKSFEKIEQGYKEVEIAKSKALQKAQTAAQNTPSQPMSKALETDEAQDETAEPLGVDASDPAKQIIDQTGQSSVDRVETATPPKPRFLMPEDAFNEDDADAGAQSTQSLSASERKARGLTKKKTSTKVLKLLPFVIGIIILAAYGTIQFSKNANTASQSGKMSKQAEQERNRDQSSVDDADLANGVTGRDSMSTQQTDGDETLYASGAAYDQFGRPKSPSKQTSNTENLDGDKTQTQLDEIRRKVNAGERSTIEDTEKLFPDEKMMSLIKDMLDMAGAEGIDVRFKNGQYDVFGYVMDDDKWSRIFKILTFDLDLSKVTFSVETSESLLNKFESLLEKFNLSPYVVLSLGVNGEILAKTYYPPAMEGLWFTIKTRFEEKFGQYTRIREFRAHLGWINVVKVSYDQPSYLLLADGRRVVEGSVLGGDTVLDDIMDDAVRVRASGSAVRYYAINKPTSAVQSDLSQRDSWK